MWQRVSLTTMWMVVAVAFTMFGSGSPAAWAHKVNVYAYPDGDRVVVEGYFGGKSKVVESPVEVLDTKGQKILEGKTDGNGSFSFALADLPHFEGDLKIVLIAGQGHRAEFTLAAAELPGTKGRSSTASKPPAPSGYQSGSVVSGNETLQKPDAPLTRKVLEEALDGKMQPIMAMLSNQQKILMEQERKGPGFVEVVGGIGWIFGICGVAAYFMSRKNKG